MLKAETQSSTEQCEQYSPEEFLEKLYEDLEEDLIKGEDARVLKEFKPESVQSWETQGIWPTGTITLGIDIEKALLIEDEKNVYALVLSRRLRSRYDRSGRTLGLQFGFFPRPSEDSKFNFGPDSTTEDLALIVNQQVSHGSGEFYIDDFNRVTIRFWADDWPFGGDEVDKWESERLQSDPGINACKVVVKETIRRAFH